MLLQVIIHFALWGTLIFSAGYIGGKFSDRLDSDTESR